MEETTSSNSRLSDAQKLAELKVLCSSYPKNYLASIKKGTALGHFSDGSLMRPWIEERTEEMCKTSSVSFPYELKTRVWWVLNEVKSWEDPLVKCAKCGKPLEGMDVMDIVKGYRRKTCSKECERKKASESNERKMLEKYGVKNAFQIPEVLAGFEARKDERQARRDATRKKNFGDAPGWNLKQSLQTRRERYGCAWNQKEVRATKALLHGDPNWNNPEKNFQTKKQNGTLNTSKPEEETYELLCKKLGAEDIIRQHKTKEYPFACDFYIISKDLYIECNYSWTHGGHFFDETSYEDLAQVEHWKAKGTQYYLNAIKTWTFYDVNKRKAAADNNLNYIVWWNLDEAKAAIKSWSSN